jgi:ketosteroid isomerase-like protein
MSSGLASSMPPSSLINASTYFIDASSVSAARIRRLTLTSNGSPPNRQHRKNPVISNLDHIRSYYDALNTGDAELVASHFTDDAVHYYTRLGPHEGAERIGMNSKLGVEQIDGQWYLEHGIEQGDEAVIEWTMTWRDPKSGEKRLDRGTEWFLMRDGKIAEVRAYHHGNKKNPQGDLLGFDHKGRGHTMLEGWRPPKQRTES